MMLDLDKDGSDPLADHLRDLMDPVWRRLSDREIALLDSRGEVGDALFPVQLPAPAASVSFPLPTVANQRFDGSGGVGWYSGDDWKERAA